MNTKITAKDFFLHLGVIAAFYASAGALIALLFEVINFAYPKITNAYQYYSPSISFQAATLIVAFPLFLLLSWFMHKTYAANPGLRDNPLRKGLSYLTLFVAGAVVAGDLVAVIYMFLDGQELTAGFLLKVLSLLVIVGGIFVYYLREIKNAISGSERNFWRIISAAIVLGSIILGFAVIGSPRAQRERRQDIERVSDLQSIQWQVINYWQNKQLVPANLDSLKDSISGFVPPSDPKTKSQYEYRKTGPLTFELCATFDREAKAGEMPPYYSADYGAAPMPVKPGLPESWTHGAGRTCFVRTIDPELYPPVKR